MAWYKEVENELEGEGERKEGKPRLGVKKEKEQLESEENDTKIGQLKNEKAQR